MIRILACGRWTEERAAALAGLRAAGYAVETSADGAGPIECVVGPAPDLLLYGAEGAGHWESDALRLVRRVHPSLPVVVVTPDGSVQERLRLAAIAPAYVAVDPIESAELCDAIEALVGPHGNGRRGPARPGSTAH